MDPHTDDPAGATPSEGLEPANAASRDTWTSPLWGRPDTVGGYWPEPAGEDPLPRLEASVAPARRGTSGRLLAAVGLLVAALLVGVGIVRALPHDASAPVASPPSVSAPATPLPSTPSTPDNPGQGLLPAPDQVPGGTGGATSSVDQAAVAAVAPALVNITTTVGYDGGEAAGTGIVLTSDGIVLTNHHVIAGATSIRASVAGTTTTYAADVIGYDASHDVGVIKLRGASGLTTAPLGDSSGVTQGDRVIGLGNAGGLGGKPIAAGGTVTGLDRSITAMDSANGVSEELSGLIETDAAIAPGDSGGALVSSGGKVVGIITAGSVSSTGRATGTDGYAIPINQALSIAQDIRDGRATSTNHLGASAFLGISVAGSAAGSQGVIVAGVVPGSAAARAGLGAGDLVTALDGTRVTTNVSLRALIARHHPGDTVSLTWVDSTGTSHTRDITLGTGPVG